jgi:hypothetical protein
MRPDILYGHDIALNRGTGSSGCRRALVIRILRRPEVDRGAPRLQEVFLYAGPQCQNQDAKTKARGREGFFKPAGTISRAGKCQRLLRKDRLLGQAFIL